MEALEDQFNRKLIKDLNTHLPSILHRTGVDVLDLRDQLERNPKHWKAIEDDFPELLRRAQVNLKAAVENKWKGVAN